MNLFFIFIFYFNLNFIFISKLDKKIFKKYLIIVEYIIIYTY